MFLAIPVALFWRPGHFFFILDDWTSLLQMRQLSFWQYLTTPDGEVFMPLSRLIYWLLIHILRDRYDYLLLINSLLTGLNSYLLFHFFRHHFKTSLAAVLSLFYVGAAIHSATVEMAYYSNVILCLGFLLLSLLLTQNYIRNSSLYNLSGIGIFTWLSINSWSFSLLAIWALPIYAALFGGEGARKKFWMLSLVVGLVFLCFSMEYFIFAGLGAASSQNPMIFSQFPIFRYLSFWIVGAFLAPFYFLFRMHLGFDLRILLPAVFLILTVALIMRAGKSSERKLCLWALTINALPLLLVAVGRSRFTIAQAFTERYGIFTLIGSLLVVGIAWQILSRKLPQRLGVKLLLPFGMLVLMLWGQFHSTPDITKIYLELSKESKTLYSKLGDEKTRDRLSTPKMRNQLFFTQVNVNPFLTNGEALSLYRFLSGFPQKQSIIQGDGGKLF